MERNKVGVIEEDVNDGMQCINHPHTKNPGGICAFCLQEKLGKLVSSSFPLPIITASSSSSPPLSSSSSPPSFRSDTLSTSSSLSHPPKNDLNMRSRLPFLLPKKNKKKHSSMMNPSSFSSSVASASATSDVVFKRSKSTATPRRTHFLDENNAENEDFSFRKRNGFWSFLYLSSKPSSSCSKKLEAKSFRECNSSLKISTLKPRVGSYLGRNGEMVVEEVDDEEETGSLEQRKVSRSRSVGCGSRSFSGDFFERISTGFGDCTLRRVESQREGNKVNKVGSNIMKERVRCGGIFGGFMMMTSSSSSSTSSYWVSSNVDDGIGRSKNTWAWALASPIRAFTKNSSKDNKRDKNATPNLSAVPSLLTVRS